MEHWRITESLIKSRIGVHKNAENMVKEKQSLSLYDSMKRYNKWPQASIENNKTEPIKQIKRRKPEDLKG